MSITDFPDLQRITAANLKPSYPADTLLFVENPDGTRSTYFTDKTGVPRECGRSLQKVIEQINDLNGEAKTFALLNGWVQAYANFNCNKLRVTGTSITGSIMISNVADSVAWSNVLDTQINVGATQPILCVNRANKALYSASIESTGIVTLTEPFPAGIYEVHFSVGVMVNA